HQELRDQSRHLRFSLVRITPEACYSPVAVLDVVVTEDELRVRLGPVAEVLIEHCQEEVVLTREVRVDGALRVAGFLGDLVERRRVEAATQEHSPRRLDQLRPCPLLPLSS